MKSFGFKSMLMASAIALSTIVSPLEAVTQKELRLQKLSSISSILIRDTMTEKQRIQIRNAFANTAVGIMFDPALPGVLRTLTPSHMEDSGIIQIASVFSKMKLESFFLVKKCCVASVPASVAVADEATATAGAGAVATAPAAEAEEWGPWIAGRLYNGIDMVRSYWLAASAAAVSSADAEDRTLRRGAGASSASKEEGLR